MWMDVDGVEQEVLNKIGPDKLHSLMQGMHYLPAGQTEHSR